MAGSICPVCGSNDCVQSVNTLLSEGISTETNVGVGYVGGGFAPFISGGQSRTMLAQRLMPPAPPGYLSALGVMVPFWLFNIVAAFMLMLVWKGGDAFVNIFVFILDYILCLIPAIIAGLVFFLPFWLLIHWHPRRKRVWEQNMNYLAGSYYCGRDDLVFDAAENYGAPESFIPRIFATSR